MNKLGEMKLYNKTWNAYKTKRKINHLYEIVTKHLLNWIYVKTVKKITYTYMYLYIQKNSWFCKHVRMFDCNDICIWPPHQCFSKIQILWGMWFWTWFKVSCKFKKTHLTLNKWPKKAPTFVSSPSRTWWWRCGCESTGVSVKLQKKQNTPIQVRK